MSPSSQISPPSPSSASNAASAGRATHATALQIARRALALAIALSLPAVAAPPAHDLLDRVGLLDLLARRGSAQLRSSASDESLEPLAQARLAEVAPSALDALIPDHDAARAYVDAATASAAVYAHYHDGSRVEGSRFVVKHEADGTVQILDRLLPVDDAPHDLGASTALAAARAHFEREEGTAAKRDRPLELDADVVYVVPPGHASARRAYRITRAGDTADAGAVLVEAASARVIGIEPDHADANDDADWSQAAEVVVTHPTDPNVACLVARAPWTVDYYGTVDAPAFQLHTFDILGRLREPDIGLTTVRWPGKLADIASNDWTAINSSVAYARNGSKLFGGGDCPGWPQHPAYPGENMSAEAAGGHWALQKTLRELDRRFGWKGASNSWGPLLYVADLMHEDNVCRYVPSKTLIACSLFVEDDSGSSHLFPTPPLDLIAHEFAHHVLRKKGVPHSAQEDAGLHEGLADVLATFVEATVKPANTWVIGNEVSFMGSMNELRCANSAPDYCTKKPQSLRDLRHPKTFDAWMPSPTAYEKTYYYGTVPTRHTDGHVVSYAMHLLDEGGIGCVDDVACAPGSSIAYEVRPIGLEATREIVWESLELIPAANPSRMLGYLGTAVPNAARNLCGRYSNEHVSASNAAFAVNTGPAVSYGYAGYEAPAADAVDVPVWAKFKVTTEDAFDIEYEVALEPGFNSIVHRGKTDGFGKFQLELEPDTDYWWRVRDAHAPMLSRKHMQPMAESLCWRPTRHFKTGKQGAKVSNPTPASGAHVQPWGVSFGFDGVPHATGYELMVDDAEPVGRSPYLIPGAGDAGVDQVANLLVYAHLDLPAPPTPDGESVAPATTSDRIPLPQDKPLRWQVRAYFDDHEGKRHSGPWAEQMFETVPAVTHITAPKMFNGTKPIVHGQPMTIAFNPADFALEHIASIRTTDVEPLDPFGWAGYQPALVSDIDARSVAIAAEQKVDWLKLVEPTNPPRADDDWDVRTFDRMLAVRLPYSGVMSAFPSAFRLEIESVSPEISSAESGGTHAPRVETTKAKVDFGHYHPSEDLAPKIVAPITAGACNADDPLAIEFEHGADATPARVPKYRIDLYPEWCHAGASPGAINFGNLAMPAANAFCPPFERVEDPAFLAHPWNVRLTVAHHGYAGAQTVSFPRPLLFSELDTLATGYQVIVSGLSGPNPGPEGLVVSNLELDSARDLPILPHSLDTSIAFDTDNQQIVVGAAARRRDSDQPTQGAYALPAGMQPAGFRNVAVTGRENDPLVELFNGSGCAGSQRLKSNGASHAMPLEWFDDIDGASIELSARSSLAWPKCGAVESACTNFSMPNPYRKPAPIPAVTARQEGATLLGVWNRPADPDIDHYEVEMASTDPQFPLFHMPEEPFGWGEADSNAAKAAFPGAAGDQQILARGPLDIGDGSNDVGKAAVVRVRACTEHKCSDVTESNPVGIDGPGSGIPEPPIHLDFAQQDSLSNFQQFEQQQGGNLPPVLDMMTVHWDPATGGPAPTYFAITFAYDSEALDADLLPTWLNNAGSLAYDGPKQYATIVRHDPAEPTMHSGSASTLYAMYVGHYDTAASYGTSMEISIRACTGTAPLPPGAGYAWVQNDGLDQCSLPATIIAPIP